MATNFEFYKDEIMERVDYGFSFAKKDGNIVSCKGLKCSECDFGENCIPKMFEWLYEEHIEPPKLTKSEREFCEIVARGVLARDKDGHLSLFSIGSEVYKCEGAWMRKTALCNYFNINKDKFKFIKWEDEKPWAVEDLLKLEVQEDA